MYQSKLIPRLISSWGLVGGIFIIAMGLLSMFGHSVFYLAIPLVLNEIVLALWLIAKGFSFFPSASE
jgi:hypothetical protein